VAAGGNNTMVKTVGGALLAFGQNKYGCLGVGDYKSRTIPSQAIHQPFPPLTSPTSFFPRARIHVDCIS